MSGHTPGPWRVVYTGDGYEIVGDGNPSGTVALVMARVSKTGEADAGLIAAAPKMLAALEEIAAKGGVDTGDPSRIELSAAGHLECRRIARAAVTGLRGSA